MFRRSQSDKAATAIIIRLTDDKASDTHPEQAVTCESKYGSIQGQLGQLLIAPPLEP